MAKNKEFEISFRFDYISDLISTQNSEYLATVHVHVDLILLQSHYLLLQSKSLHLAVWRQWAKQQSYIALNIKCNFSGLCRGGEKRNVFCYTCTFLINVLIYQCNYKCWSWKHWCTYFLKYINLTILTGNTISCSYTKF